MQELTSDARITCIYITLYITITSSYQLSINNQALLHIAIIICIYIHQQPSSYLVHHHVFMRISFSIMTFIHTPKPRVEQYSLCQKSPTNGGTTISRAIMSVLAFHNLEGHVVNPNTSPPQKHCFTWMSKIFLGRMDFLLLLLSIQNLKIGLETSPSLSVVLVGFNIDLQM